MNACLDHFQVDADVLAQRQASAVASALNMIADQIRLTAQTTQHEPLVRRRIGDVVGSLIELADALAGDADLEPDNDDEPSLGWGSSLLLDAGFHDDRECDAGDEPEVDHDFEEINEDGSEEGL